MLTDRCTKVKNVTGSVRKEMPEILKNLREKLSRRVQELSSELENDRFEQELLFLSQKMDVEEES